MPAIPDSGRRSIGRNYYFVNFASLSNQNPLSDDNKWTNGSIAGLSDMRVVSGLCCGTQIAGAAIPPYKDSRATLGGHWGPDQWCRGLVGITNPQDNTSNFEEVEICLNMRLAVNYCGGFDCNARCATTFDQYWQRGRWNGTPMPPDDTSPGSGIYNGATSYAGAAAGQDGTDNRVVSGLANGDEMAMTYINGVLRIYKNGVEVGTGIADQVIPRGHGAPGIGQWARISGVGNAVTDYGLTTFEAADFPIFNY